MVNAAKEKHNDYGYGKRRTPRKAAIAIHTAKATRRPKVDTSGPWPCPEEVQQEPNKTTLERTRLNRMIAKTRCKNSKSPHKENDDYREYDDRRTPTKANLVNAAKEETTRPQLIKGSKRTPHMRKVSHVSEHN